MSQLLLVAASAYALGCVVGAYYLVRHRRGVDVRASGSGTAGARNVYRSGDLVGATLTLVWDLAKGAMVVVVAAQLAPPWSAAAAILGVVAGHVWPVQLGLRGGKGVATATGCTIALALVSRTWPSVAGAAIAWLLVVFTHQHTFQRQRNALRALTHSGENGS